MATIAANGFGGARRQRADRNVFLIFVALVWVGVLTGFGTDSVRHVSEHGLDYPLIVHAHAVTFLSWLALFTVQTALIRRDAPALHRRLGVFGAGLAAAMLVLGPATAIWVDGARHATSGQTPEFLAVQLSDMLVFGVLTGCGLALRHHAASHKRLMLLGLFYLSDAGFARFLNGFVAAPLGQGQLGEWAALYFGSTALMVALGIYDWRTRGRLYPAYVAAMAGIVAAEIAAIVLLHDAGWKALSLRLIGA